MFKLKRTNLWLPGEVGEGTVREFRKVYTLLHLSWITNKDLLCIAPGTLLSGMCQCGRERSLGKNGYIYIYITAESLHCSPETITTLLVHSIPLQNKKFKA